MQHHWSHNAIAVGVSLLAILLVVWSSWAPGSTDAVFPPLPPLHDPSSTWPAYAEGPRACAMGQPLRVFIQELPDMLEELLPAANRSKCRWSAYSSELLLYRQLVDVVPDERATTAKARKSLNVVKTADWEQADLVFVPLFGACYLFNCWSRAHPAPWNQTERCDVDRRYMQPIMEWVQQQPAWQRHGGRDHLIPHPMDHASDYYSEESKSLMQHATYLVTNGDLRGPPFSAHYRGPGRDIVIPSTTHLVHSYKISPRDWVDGDGWPRVDPHVLPEPDEFIVDDSMPIDLFLPSPGGFPTITSRFYRSMRTSVLHCVDAVLRTSFSPPAHPPRPLAVVFRGAHHVEAGEKHGLGVRSLFFPAKRHRGFSSLRGWDIATSSSNADYARALANAKYGLVPPGWTLDSTRLWEYLAFGVVPVFIATGPKGGQVMPFASSVDWEGMSVSVARDQAHLLPQILAGVSEDEYEEKRKLVWDTGRKLVLDDVHGHAWSFLAREACWMMEK